MKGKQPSTGKPHGPGGRQLASLSIWRSRTVSRTPKNTASILAEASSNTTFHNHVNPYTNIAISLVRLFDKSVSLICTHPGTPIFWHGARVRITRPTGNAFICAPVKPRLTRMRGDRLRVEQVFKTNEMGIPLLAIGYDGVHRLLSGEMHLIHNFSTIWLMVMVWSFRHRNIGFSWSLRTSYNLLNVLVAQANVI